MSFTHANAAAAAAAGAAWDTVRGAENRVVEKSMNPMTTAAMMGIDKADFLVLTFIDYSSVLYVGRQLFEALVSSSANVTHIAITADSAQMQQANLWRPSTL